MLFRSEVVLVTDGYGYAGLSRDQEKGARVNSIHSLLIRIVEKYVDSFHKETR